MKIYKLTIGILIIGFIAIVSLFTLVSNRSKVPDVSQIEFLEDAKKEIQVSLETSWAISQKLDLGSLFIPSENKTLGESLPAHALILFVTDKGCSSCLERNLKNFSTINVAVSKYIIGYDINSRFFKELQKRHQNDISGAFLIDNSLSVNTNRVPFMIYKEPGSKTIFCATKSDYGLFEAFKRTILRNHE